uniref:Retrovirus-related Pol polyprotein from transposon TNT 1-94 n=1 Tax=Tanacetum cinerariifolium TaxID=118510 RepID=A0A6L2P4L8_TANCI|nr:hypothetical protein [Tanacetum cinerariifolium]
MWNQETVGYNKHALWVISHWGRKRQQFYGFAVNRESTGDVYSKRKIISVTELKIIEWHNYKHLDWITVRRDDDKLCKFKEGDFKRLRIQDIKDMLLLLVQGKLTNLMVEERFAFNISLRMFTRSIVIQRRVEDLQLGVESYQKKLNLISDGTLTDFRTALDDRLKGIRMKKLKDGGEGLPTNIYSLVNHHRVAKDLWGKVQLLMQALGFHNPFYLKKAWQIKPMLYDGNVITKETNVISIADSKKTLMLKEESGSKMILKQSDPTVLEMKVNTKPINYAELNQISKDFGKCFVPRRELSDEQVLHPITDQSASLLVKIKALQELPKLSLKKQFLIENDRLLDQIISLDIVNIVVNSSVDVYTLVKVNSSVVMNDFVNFAEIYNKCLELEAELIKQHNMVQKDEYNRLSKRFSEIKQHCIFLETAMQLNKEIFQKNNTSMNQNEPSFNQLFELNNLKAELQVKYTTIEKLKANIKRNIPKVPNMPLLSSTGVNPSTSASGSKPLGNTKNDRILRTPSSNEKNKNLVKYAKALCSVCNECLFDANHSMYLIDHVNSMNMCPKFVSKKNKKRKEWKPTGKVFNSIRYKWKPTGRTFTLVGNVCPLTRLTTTKKVPLRVLIPLEVVAPKHIVTRVYTRRPKVPKSIQNSKPKVAKSVTANIMEPDTYRGSNTSVGPSPSSLIDCRDIMTSSPMVEKSKLDEDTQGKAIDLTHYRGMARPTEKHLHAVKRIFRYLRGAVNREP